MLDSADAECIAGVVTGPAYQALIDWRQNTDVEVMRAQIADLGRAMVIRLHGKNMLKAIADLPDPGEAEPYYGSFGGGYQYRFNYGEQGWLLQVENLAHRSFRSGLQEPLPALLLDDPANVRVHALPESPSGMKYSGARGLRSNGDYEQAEQAFFSIHEEMYAKLAEWGWTPARIAQYAYIFVPLSVGCEILVEHLATHAQIHLTKDIGW
ncbi:MAG TPA: hypothetical protein VFX76_22915 [Roseiflexaceae bacterium]|nr:hypothetical protein [Roseiflexaceae bacterium]